MILSWSVYALLIVLILFGCKFAWRKNEFNDDNGVYDAAKFITFQLDKMKAAMDTVKYKLELKVVKNGDDWDVTQLSTTDLEKIHGIYNYEEE